MPVDVVHCETCSYKAPVARAVVDESTLMPAIFTKKITILMVCSANICRSPTAQGILQGMIRERGLKRRIRVDSAGTHVPRPGARPDQRAQQAASEGGYPLGGYKSRMLESSDYRRYDYIVAMDRKNRRHMEQACPPDLSHKLLSIMDYYPGTSIDEVPDPYFGNLAGFERVVELLEPACAGFLDYLCAVHGLE